MEMRHYWEENGNSHKYDNGFNHSNGYGPAANDQLNFAAASEDEGDYPTSAYLKKGKVSRQDPMSHRIIEKRRRDRMNNCLADLSRLIPPEYLKKGRGRVEKTEIIEMAIRHLKYLQERASERQQGEEPFIAGYQGAVTEVLRFLVEVQGYEPSDGLCAQLYAHMQLNCEAVSKGEAKCDKSRLHQQSSDTASSSSNSYSYASQPPATSETAPAPSYNPEHYDDQPQDEFYSMESDKADAANSRDAEPVPLDGRRKKDPTLRAVRKPDHSDDQIHSYKFKNSIERRFSKSQDNEAAEMSARSTHKIYPHKRRRTAKHSPSTSTSASGYTEETTNTSAKDTSSESTTHQHYEKPQLPTQYVPVFALNSLGKYYVPLNVDYACLSKHLGPYDALDARAVQLAAPLHPVTIHVNFQPSLNYHVKREIVDDREWRPV